LSRGHLHLRIRTLRFLIFRRSKEGRGEQPLSAWTGARSAVERACMLDVLPPASHCVVSGVDVGAPCAVPLSTDVPWGCVADTEKVRRRMRKGTRQPRGHYDGGTESSQWQRYGRGYGDAYGFADGNAYAGDGYADHGENANASWPGSPVGSPGNRFDGRAAGFDRGSSRSPNSGGVGGCTNAPNAGAVLLSMLKGHGFSDIGSAVSPKSTPPSARTFSNMGGLAIHEVMPVMTPVGAMPPMPAPPPPPTSTAPALILGLAAAPKFPPQGDVSTPGGDLWDNDVDDLLHLCATAHLDGGEPGVVSATVSAAASAGVSKVASNWTPLLEDPVAATLPTTMAPALADGTANYIANRVANVYSNSAIDSPKGSAGSSAGAGSASGSAGESVLRELRHPRIGAFNFADGASSGAATNGVLSDATVRVPGSQLAQDTLEKVFKPWCKQRATQLFRFAHRRFSSGEGRGCVIFRFERTRDVTSGKWPVDEAGWRYLGQRAVGQLGIKTNHVLSAVQRYSPQQQCVVIALVKEAKFDRFYFLNAPKSHMASPLGSGAEELTEWYSSHSSGGGWSHNGSQNWASGCSGGEVQHDYS